MSTTTLPVPIRTSTGIRSQRFSRHRLSTTPPRVSQEEIEEEYDISEEEDDQEDCMNDSTVQLLFNKIYVDPLQNEFEALDGEAGNILRTGKFSVTGDTGSMDLLQPLLFSLQATEEDLTLLLPQLMQNPFFNPSQKQYEFQFGVEPSVVLSGGYIRLGVKVDTVIYDLLSSFCTKGPGSKQADALINAGLKTTYNLPSSSQTFQFRCQNGPPLVANGYIIDVKDLDSSGSEEELSHQNRMSPPFLTKLRSSSSSITSSGIVDDFIELPLPNNLVNNLKRSASGSSRRTSVIDSPWINCNSQYRRKSSEISDVSCTTPILGGDNHWRVEIDSPANDTIIGSHSENSYSILSWNPKFKIQFELGSQEDGMFTTTYCVDSNKPSVNVHLFNFGDEPIAFSIRAYRQSLMFRSHIIYPQNGLKDLDVQQVFTQDFDVVGSEGMQRDEHIIIDLLICKLHGEPSWNIQRRYIILKYDGKPASKTNQSSEKRLLRKLYDGGMPLEPGHHRDLCITLKQVILHGLQCVVKNKIEEAEIIFTQALHLPLFQRVTLKAFAYICLAVIADKRRKKFIVHRVNHIFKLVIRLEELLDACDSAAASHQQMPKMVGLIKQLKKELNLKKILEGYQSKKDTQKAKRLDITKMIRMQGDMMKLDHTSVLIPGGALLQDTTLTLSNMSPGEIHQALQSSQWASMLNIIAAFEITCSPPIVQFNAPIIATIELPHDIHMPSPPFCLLQSKFMNNWIDITNEPNSTVTLNDRTLKVRTKHTGWLLVATINLNPSQILQIAVKSLFVEEPVTLQVNIFGRQVSENSTEITTFITPATKDDSILNQKKDSPSNEHKRISFPRSFKAYKGQRIRLQLQGPNESADVIASDHVVDSQLESVMTRDIQSIKGKVQKLIITKFCNVHNEWETVQDITL